jgi:hypothetical protein
MGQILHCIYMNLSLAEHFAFRGSQAHLKSGACFATVQAALPGYVERMVMFNMQAKR